MFERLSKLLIAIAAATLVTACESSPAIRSETPSNSLVLQLGRENGGAAKPIIHPVLTFETADDAVFAASPGGATIDPTRHRGGTASLKIADLSQGTTLRLGLAAGVALPDRWPSIEFRALSQTAGELKWALAVPGQPPIANSTPLAIGVWTECAIDLTPWEKQVIESKEVVLTLNGSPGEVWIDDVVLTDNEGWIVSPTADELPWSVRRRGRFIIADRAGAFSTSLAEAQPNITTKNGEAGWRLVEADDLRLIAESDGPTKHLAIYNDGRSFWNGELKPLSVAARSRDFAAEHARPALVSVLDDQGRIDRTSPGDTNNDGYNEQTGDYRLIARGRRLDIRVEPRGTPATRSVFAIAGLPAGIIAVVCEGQPIPNVVRLGDGRVLFMLTQSFSRPTTINVSTK